MSHSRTAGMGNLLAVAAFVALGLNAPVWWRRLGEAYGSLSPAWKAVAGGSEALLVFSTTALLLLVAALFGRWVWRLALAGFVAVSALCAYFMSQFNVLIGYGVVQAVFTTDHDMSGEVLGMRLLAWWLLLGLLPLVWFWRRPAPPSLWQWLRGRASPGQGKALLLVVALLALAFSAGRWGLKAAGPQVRGADTELVANLAGVAAHSYVPSNWISGSAMVAANAWGMGGNRTLRAPAQQHRYEASTASDDVTVVVVIGETARHDHWGMLGYARDTTPKMAALPGVAAFRATSCDTSTKLSISCMFVRPEGIRPGDGLKPDTILEETVFSVFRHLGFSIELHAMQSEVGLYQRMQPDRYKMREMIFADPQWAKLPRNDLLLVNELKADLARHPKGRHVSILHLKGSHYLYTQRYPREFARWQPECPDVDAGCRKALLINSYDNSILFTDHVLNEVVAQLKGRRAMLLYTSDHGESIDDNSHFHATPRALAPPEQRRVPLLVWATPELRADPVLRPGFEQLQARAAADADGRTTHANIFATLLGCIGVRSPDGGLNPAQNLCQPAP